MGCEIPSGESANKSAQAWLISQADLDELWYRRIKAEDYLIDVSRTRHDRAGPNAPNRSSRSSHGFCICIDRAGKRAKSQVRKRLCLYGDLVV
jgi:hypothetical protein